MQLMDSVAVSRTRSCTDKLGSSWEREKAHRAAKRYDDDGHGSNVGNGTAAACCCYYGDDPPPPPTNDQTSNDKEKRRGAKLLTALVHVKPDGHGAPRCFQPIIT